MSNTLFSVRGFTPEIGQGCFIAPNSSIIGDVKIGDHSSVWFNAVVLALESLVI